MRKAKIFVWQSYGARFFGIVNEGGKILLRFLIERV
jgi:hypothetical protein